MGIYFFGQRLGLKSCLKGHYDIGIKRILLPVNYWRYPVFRYAEKFFKNGGPLSVLDIGSPKLLSVYLAAKYQHQVFATDIFDETIFTMWQRYYEDFQNNGKHEHPRYIAELQDARNLKYDDNKFDVVFSVSVIEHIPHDGDAEAMREIARVLKPGGIAIVEVPYALKAYDTFKDSKVYEREFDGEPVFYQRHYDDQAVEHRLLRPSGLEVVEEIVLGERWPFEQFYEKLPGAGRLLFFPFEALISTLNHKKMGERQRQRDSENKVKRAMDVTLILQKSKGDA